MSDKKEINVKDMTVEEKAEFIKSEISKSMDQFVGEKANVTTKAKVESNILSAMSRMVDMFDIPRKIPDPKVTVIGNRMNVSFINPETKEYMTVDDWVNFIRGQQ